MLHNVVKYAQASRVEVRLIKNENTLSLYVTDHGRGFHVKTMKHGSPLEGWDSSASRACAIAEWDVERHQSNPESALWCM